MTQANTPAELQPAVSGGIPEEWLAEHAAEPTAEQHRLAEAQYLHQFAADLDNGYYDVVRRVDNHLVRVASYKTRHEPYNAFKVTDDEGTATLVYTYPGRVTQRARKGKEPWQDTDEIPALHRKAIDNVRQAIDEGRAIEARQAAAHAADKARAAAPRRGGKLLGLLGIGGLQNGTPR